MVTEATQSPSTMAALGQAAIAGALRRIESHAQSAPQDSDPEHVHQIRVGLRRLRVALPLFAPYLGVGRGRRLVRVARRLGRELGATRDLDIAIALGETRLERLGPRSRRQLQGLLERWRRERDQIRLGGLETLDGRRFARFHAALTELLQRDPPDSPPAMISNHAPPAIFTAYAPIGDHAGLNAPPDVAALHRLRIRVKGLRYTLEFLSPGLNSGVDLILGRLVAVQDALGKMSDAAFCRDLLLAWPSRAERPAAAAEEIVAAAAFLRDCEAALVRLTRRGARAAKRLQANDFRRALWNLASRAGRAD